MNAETIQYLLELIIERRDQCGVFFYNATLTPETKQHWHNELARAENALAALSSQTAK